MYEAVAISDVEIDKRGRYIASAASGANGRLIAAERSGGDWSVSMDVRTLPEPIACSLPTNPWSEPRSDPTNSFRERLPRRKRSLPSTAPAESIEAGVAPASGVRRVNGLPKDLAPNSCA